MSHNKERVYFKNFTVLKKKDLKTLVETQALAVIVHCRVKHTFILHDISECFDTDG